MTARGAAMQEIVDRRAVELRGDREPDLTPHVQLERQRANTGRSVSVSTLPVGAPAAPKGTTWQ
jgi:hypothetical protein